MGRIYQLKKSVLLPRPLNEVFNYYLRMENICRLVPGYLKLKLIEAPGCLKQNDIVRLNFSLHYFPFPWEARITGYKHNERFTDSMLKGPFSFWRHQHLFKAQKGGTLVTDLVEYKLPFGFLGDIAYHVFVKQALNKIFEDRHKKALLLLGEE